MPFDLAKPVAEHGDPTALTIMIMLAAVIADAYVGDLRWFRKILPHPRDLAAGVVERFAPKLDRARRSRQVRAMRGFLLVLFLIVLAVVVGKALEWLAWHYPYGFVIEFVCLFSLISQRGPLNGVARVRRGLLGDNLEVARLELVAVTGEDPTGLDKHGVARRAMEMAARRFCDRVVAPLFWYALFGLAGLFAHTAVNVASMRVGDRSEALPRFGMAAARLDDILNMIPARLAGVLVAFASLFVATARPGPAFATLGRDARKAPAPAAGWPQSAMAGALDLALGGPRRIAGQVEKFAWLGDGRARAQPGDMRRAIFLMAVACVLNAIMLIGLAILRLRLGG